MEGIFFILSFFVGYILSFSLVRLRTVWLSARADAHIELQFEAVRTSSQQRAGPSGPLFEQPVELERSAAKDRGTWGQYVSVCSVSNSPLTHNPFATLSNKEVCSFIIIVDYVSACICG